MHNNRISIVAGVLRSLGRWLLCLPFWGLMLLCASSCSKAGSPRPYGYYRIDLPPASYTLFDGQKMPVKSKDFDIPCRFEVSEYANVQPQPHEGEGKWLDIHYDMLNADIHCSYMPIHGNLRELTDDAMEFVYKHVTQASSIPEREYVNEDAKVYGVFFALQGNTASPFQFFLTDSTRHFFRGAAYCNCRPNADSLQPILNYLDADIAHFIETFEWK